MSFVPQVVPMVPSQQMLKDLEVVCTDRDAVRFLGNGMVVTATTQLRLQQAMTSLFDVADRVKGYNHPQSGQKYYDEVLRRFPQQ